MSLAKDKTGLHGDGQVNFLRGTYFMIIIYHSAQLNEQLW